MSDGVKHKQRMQESYHRLVEYVASGKRKAPNLKSKHKFGAAQRQNSERKAKERIMNKRYVVLSRLANGINRLHYDVIDADNFLEVIATYRQKKKAVELARELNSTSGWHRVIS